jgi:predicted flap endonuclease-1-like 5' DNA nuclease
MSRNIQNVEGIGPKYAEILKQHGIDTTDRLLELCCSRSGREELAEKTSISVSKILKWVNMCDLFRINGVAGQFAELLECSGVDTIKELRNRNAENLAMQMAEVNAEKRIGKSCPSTRTVSDWIRQAKALEPLVTY